MYPRRVPRTGWLHHKVGCRKTTRDGLNFTFSSADQPGNRLPAARRRASARGRVPPTQKSDRTNAWFGVGIKTGTQFVVVGIETLAGYVASLDDLGKGMAIGSSINRVGPGVGASAGGCFIFITGVTSPAQLNGHQQGDWDFNVSLGGNWSKAAQAAGKAKKLKPLIDALAKIGARTPGGLKSALKAHPDKWVELIKAGKTVKEYVGIDPNSAPCLRHPVRRGRSGGVCLLRSLEF